MLKTKEKNWSNNHDDETMSSHPQFRMSDTDVLRELRKIILFIIR